MELGDNMANVNVANIKPPKSPNLPIAPTNYSQIYFNTLTDVLRLYFNQLDIVCKYLITPDVGRYFNFPFLAVLDDTPQTAASAGVAYPVSWSTPYLPTTYAGPNEFNPYLDPLDPTMIVIPDSHYNNFAYTLSFVNPINSGDETVAVWWRLNSATLGVIDYPGTTRYYRIQGKDHYVAANATIMLDETNGDSWQLMWATTSNHIVLAPSPGGLVGPEPTGATAALAISFVSA